MFLLLYFLVVKRREQLVNVIALKVLCNYHYYDIYFFPNTTTIFVLFIVTNYGLLHTIYSHSIVFYCL